MTRVLEFTGPKATKRFQLLWTSLLAGGDGKGERTRDVIRKEARLQDQLETISDPVPVNGGPPNARVLREGAGAVLLTQEDFDLLQQYTERTQWSPHISRDVVDLWDFLSACERKD